MNLILEASGPISGKHSNRTVIAPSGGSIGRLPENSLVLDDPHVSGRHAVIQFVDGAVPVVGFMEGLHSALAHPRGGLA